MEKILSLLFKAENPEQYAALANSGILLGYPVRIDGQHARADNGVHYHSTIKEFDHQKDHPHSIHELAQHMSLNPPDAKNTQIEPAQFKDRFGNDVFVLRLKGNSAEKLKEHNAKFSHMGVPSSYSWEPHISVPKDVHDKIKASGAKTAHEAGIEFGPAQLKKGPTVLKTYHHEPDTTEPRVPDQGDMTAKMDITKKSEEIHGQKPLMKPYVSESQRRWAHTSTGKKALGGNAGVHEWDESTKGKKLPERVSKSDELEKGEKSHTIKRTNYGTYQVLSHDPVSPKTEEWSPLGVPKVEGEHTSYVKAAKHFKDLSGKKHSWNIGKSEEVCLPKKDFIEEHKDLVDVLKHPSKKKLKRELKEQSEELKEEVLEKGMLQNAGVALGMAGALAGSSAQAAPKSHANRAPTSIRQPKQVAPAYDHGKMLNAIAQVESSGGKNMNHKPTSQGTAFGKYALMPNTIHDTIKGHKDLKAKYGKALALQGKQLHRFMEDNKGLEDVLAHRHLTHIEHNFGHDLDRIGFAWNQGVKGTWQAKNNGIDIPTHPYTKKINSAYGKGK